MLAPIESAREWFPKRDGKAVSGKAILRRIKVGHRGVRLQARRDGGRWFTCRQWVEEFQAAVTAKSIPVVCSPSASSRAVAQARAALNRRYGTRGTR